MNDFYAHVMWQQHERRVTAAAERRRLNLEAAERALAEKEQHQSPSGVGDAAAPPSQASTQLATALPC